MSHGEGTLTIEGARLIFRNFAGKEGQYNREGDRSFCVLLDPDLAAQMRRDGWNVKTLKAREEGDEEQAYLSVSVGYRYRPPRINLITSKGRTPLSQEEVEILDWIDTDNVDLIIRPYEWSVRGQSGIKAYLQTMYVQMHEDELDLKYADVQDALPARSGKTYELPAGQDDNVIEGTWR